MKGIVTAAELESVTVMVVDPTKPLMEIDCVPESVRLVIALLVNPLESALPATVLLFVNPDATPITVGPPLLAIPVTP